MHAASTAISSKFATYSFSLYDRLFEASPEELAELEEFARMLADASSELDGGLFRRYP